MPDTFSKGDFEKIQEFICRKSGIHLEQDKYYDKLSSYISKKGESLNFDSFKDYFYKLRFDDVGSEEFQSLINFITVNETYFFREKEQFNILESHILPRLNKLLSKNRPIRILSSPCSTGEEVYTIALHVLKEGSAYKNRDIEIVGIDIDSKVIEKAKEGVFSKRSVECIPKEILSDWFTQHEDSYHVSSDLVKMVDFKVVNVFDKEKMLELGKFDVIFSRNMMVYFDDASRKELAMTFYDMLTPDGFILLGEAEHMNRIVSLFNICKVDQTILYTKQKSL